MGGGARHAQCRRLEFICDLVFLAAAALLRHRLDVSRRLCARRISNDRERRSHRGAERQPERFFLYVTFRRRRFACISWNCERFLSLDRACPERRFCCRRDAVFTNPYTGGRAPALPHLDRLPAALPGYSCSVEIMNASSVSAT